MILFHNRIVVDGWDVFNMFFVRKNKMERGERGLKKIEFFLLWVVDGIYCVLSIENKSFFQDALQSLF